MIIRVGKKLLRRVFIARMVSSAIEEFNGGSPSLETIITTTMQTLAKVTMYGRITRGEVESIALSMLGYMTDARIMELEGALKEAQAYVLTYSEAPDADAKDVEIADHIQKVLRSK